MENKEIIVLDEGLEDSPIGPLSWCCAMVYAPYIGV
jgi:hypothetical protein